MWSLIRASTPGHVPGDDAAARLICLPPNATSSGWKRSVREWRAVRSQLAIRGRRPLPKGRTNDGRAQKAGWSPMVRKVYRNQNEVRANVFSHIECLCNPKPTAFETGLPQPHGVRGPRYASLTCCPRNPQQLSLLKVSRYYGLVKACPRWCSTRAP